MQIIKFTMNLYGLNVQILPMSLYGVGLEATLLSGAKLQTAITSGM